LAVRLKKPATGFPARAFNSCDDVNLPVICPTAQEFFEPSSRETGLRHRFALGNGEKRGPSDTKKPAAGFRRGLNSFDNGDMPVICPTAQDLFGTLRAGR
jgi:hypothetical protein